MTAGSEEKSWMKISPFKRERRKDEGNLNLLRIHCVTSYMVCVYFLLFLRTMWDKRGYLWWTGEAHETQKGQGKSPGHAKSKSDSLFWLDSTLTCGFFLPSMMHPEELEGLGNTEPNKTMIKQKDKSHTEDRVDGKAERIDEQCGNMKWLLQGMQLSKWKSFKGKIPQIMLGDVWVQERVCFLSTSLWELYKPDDLSFFLKRSSHLNFVLI